MCNSYIYDIKYTVDFIIQIIHIQWKENVHKPFADNLNITTIHSLFQIILGVKHVPSHIKIKFHKKSLKKIMVWFFLTLVHATCILQIHSFPIQIVDFEFHWKVNKSHCNIWCIWNHIMMWAWNLNKQKRPVEPPYSVCTLISSVIYY